MRLRAIGFVIGLAVAAIVTAVPALSQSLTFPALTGRVVDEAGIFDAATRQKLEQVSADLEAKSSDQLVIVTLKSLQGTSIEDYGYQLGRAWGIGQKGQNNGVLLIIAPNEHRVRIEVGYGLEGTLTDAISSFIVQTSVLPRFRANDFAGGASRAAEDIAQVLTGDAEEYKRRAAQAHREQPADPVDMLMLGFFIFVVLLLIMNALANMRRQSGIPPGQVRRTRNWNNDYPVIIPPGGGWGGGFGGGGGGFGGGFGGGGGSFGGGGSSGSW